MQGARISVRAQAAPMGGGTTHLTREGRAKITTAAYVSTGRQTHVGA
jgi:hypothetical protein